MASVYSITTEGEVALTAATAKTALALFSGTGSKPRIVEWGVSFDGTSATGEPVLVRLFRLTTDNGTRTTTTVEVPWDADNPTPVGVGRHNYTAEATKGSAIYTEECHPQSGVARQYPLGREIVLDNATSDGVGIELTAPANVNCVAYLVWEE